MRESAKRELTPQEFLDDLRERWTELTPAKRREMLGLAKAHATVTYGVDLPADIAFQLAALEVQCRP